MLSTGMTTRTVCPAVTSPDAAVTTASPSATPVTVPVPVDRDDGFVAAGERDLRLGVLRYLTVVCAFRLQNGRFPDGKFQRFLRQRESGQLRSAARGEQCRKGGCGKKANNFAFHQIDPSFQVILRMQGE